MGEHHHHDHSHGEHDHSHAHAVTNNLTVAFILNLSFTIIEIIGGLLTNSIAILSDAIHDFGDTVAIGSALFLEKKSEQKRDSKFSYGYRRWSTLSALINVVILTTGSIFIIAETIPRLLHPQAVHTGGMMGLAVLGLIMNGIAVFRLKGDSSLNNKTVMLHLLEDTLGWAAVLLGAVVMHFTEFYLIDPLLSLLIAAIILRNAVINLKKIMEIFLQAVPKKLDIKLLEKNILSNPEVTEVHDIHVWSMDGDFNVASLHIVVSSKEILSHMEELKQRVREEFHQLGVNHVTIEIEHPDENCELVNCVD